MSVEKVRGIVIKEMNKGETSKNLIVLAKEKGKIFMIAKGARKSKSHLMASSQIFSYCDFITYTSGNSNKYYNIMQSEIIDTFYNIRMDVEKLAYSYYIIELVEKTCLENMECNNIIILILKTFSFMSKLDINKINPRFVVVVFQIKYMVISGFMPQTENCVFCGNYNDITYFSNIEGGVMCQNCKKNGIEGIRISQGAYKSLKYIIKSDISKIFMFRISDDVLNEIFNISKQYILTHININFKTLDFAESLRDI